MRTLRFAALLCLTAAASAADYSAATGNEPDPSTVMTDNYQDVLTLFDQLGYTAEAWQAGIRVVPRIYLAEIPDRWGKKTSKEIDVELKKRLFFRAIGPLALRSNELILENRKELEALMAQPEPMMPADREWLDNLARQYGLEPDAYTDAAELESALLPRVDIIPPSLVLAQAAEESGWGTSRFAFSGNALFGQWTWGGAGIRPEQQRSGRGDYKIAAFAAPLESVQAHARNLNTHSAYLQFRIKRAQMRADSTPVSGYQLAGALTSYSERGLNYVKTVRGIISYNKLDAADDAYLDDKQPIVLVSPSDEETQP